MTQHQVAAVSLLALLAVLVAFFVVRAELHKRRSVREGFAWTDWNFRLTGRVGEAGLLTEEKQAQIREEIDKANNSTESCEHADVYLPHEWRPTEKHRTCSLDMINTLVRNRCEPGNSPLYDDRVIETLYVDPDTLKCHVVFKDGVSKEQMEEYKRSVNIGELLREVRELKRRIKELEIIIFQLREDIRELRNTLEEQQREIRSLRDRIDYLNGVINELQQQIRTLEREIKTVERKIRTVEQLTIKDRLRPSFGNVRVVVSQEPDKPEFVGARAGNFGMSGNPREDRGVQFFCENGSMPDTVYRVGVENGQGERAYGDMTVSTGSSMYERPHVLFYTPEDQPITGKVVLQASTDGGDNWGDVNTQEVENATRLKFGCTPQP